MTRSESLSPNKRSEKTTLEVLKLIDEAGGKIEWFSLWHQAKAKGISYPGLKEAYKRLVRQHALKVEPNPERGANPTVVLLTPLERVSEMVRIIDVLQDSVYEPFTRDLSPTQRAAGLLLTPWLFSNLSYSDILHEMKASEAEEFVESVWSLHRRVFSLWERLALRRLDLDDRDRVMGVWRKISQHVQSEESDKWLSPPERVNELREALYFTGAKKSIENAEETMELVRERGTERDAGVVESLRKEVTFFSSISKEERRACRRMGEELGSITLFAITPPHGVSRVPRGLGVVSPDERND